MNLLKKYKLQPVLVLVVGFFILALLIVQGAILYASSSKLIAAKVGSASLVTLEQMNERLTERLESIKQTALSIKLNENIRKMLINGPEQGYFEQIQSNEYLNVFLSNITNSHNDISEIVIVTDRLMVYNYSNPNGFYEKSRMEGKEFWSQIENRDEGFLSTRINDISQNSSNHYVITYFSKLYGQGNTELGILCININEKSIRNLLEARYPEGNILSVVDSEGNIISPFYQKNEEQNSVLKSYFSSDRLMMDNPGTKKVELNKKQYLIINTTPNQLGWRIVQLKPYEEIEEGISEISRKIIIMGLLFFLGVVGFLIFFSRSIFTPIKKLIGQMRRVGGGNFAVEIDEGYSNEIGDLNYNFKKMTGQIQDLIQKVEVDHKKILEAELKALHSQINPHFLYNTLDSINWMAIKAKTPEISKMAADLGLLFRLSLNKGNELAPVLSEIEHVRCYLRIQGFRYNYKFRVVEDFEPEIFNYLTVKLILQPLVENSLIHGFENTRGAGEITISGRICGEMLLLTVRDNGCGLDADFMNDCLKASISTSKGYGLKNVDQRIKIHFGEEFGLTYVPTGVGTQVEIRLPKIKIQEDDESAEAAGCR